MRHPSQRMLLEGLLGLPIDEGECVSEGGGQMSGLM